MHRLNVAILSLWLALAPASAQVGGLSFPGPGPIVASSAGFSLTFESDNPSTAKTTTVAYGTFAFGGGCNSLIIGDEWYNTNNTDTIAGMAVSGNSAPSHVASSGPITSGPGQVTADVWQLNSPVGTSATISTTYSVAPSFDSAVGVYCLVSAHTTPGTPTTAQIPGGTANSVNQSVTVAVGGSALILCSSETGQAITLTNGTIDQTVTTSGGGKFVFGHTTASGSVSVTCSVASNDAMVLSLTPYGP